MIGDSADRPIAIATAISARGQRSPWPSAGRTWSQGDGGRRGAGPPPVEAQGRGAQGSTDGARRAAEAPSEFEGADRPAENGWIIHSDGLRLGCVFVVADDSATARLRLMLVEPFARGRGIGQTLIDTAIGHARGQGFEKMVLWTEEEFHAACRLYERNGFRVKTSEANRLFGRDVVDQSRELIL